MRNMLGAALVGGAAPTVETARLTNHGVVSVVRHGEIFTPPLAPSILQGLTTTCVLTLSGDLGFGVHEQQVPRELLYMADEVFCAAAAAEIEPIHSIDGITIGAGGADPLRSGCKASSLGSSVGRFLIVAAGSRPSASRRLHRATDLWATLRLPWAGPGLTPVET